MKPAHAGPLLTKGSNVSLGVAAFFGSWRIGDGETDETSGSRSCFRGEWGGWVCLTFCKPYCLNERPNSVITKNNPGSTAEFLSYRWKVTNFA